MAKIERKSKSKRRPGVEEEIAEAKKQGRAIPPIFAGDGDSVRRSSPGFVATRLDIHTATLHRVADTDVLGGASLTRKPPVVLPPSILEAARGRIELLLKQAGETPSNAALRQLLQEFSAVRASGIDPKWSQKVDERIEKIMRAGVEIPPPSRGVYGGGRGGSPGG